MPLFVPELDRVAEPLVEEGAVGEAGQRVVEGELPQLVLRLALASDVEEVALEVERLPVVVEDDDALVAQVDDASVAGDEPVLEAERLVRLVRLHVRGEHALAVFRVEQPGEQLGIGRPFLDAVAEDRLDLAAREDVRADRVERVDVDDERELLDQRAIAADDLVCGQVVVIVLAERDWRRRHSHGIGSAWETRASPGRGIERREGAGAARHKRVVLGRFRRFRCRRAPSRGRGRSGCTASAPPTPRTAPSPRRSRRSRR